MFVSLIPRISITWYWFGTTCVQFCKICK
jgi:hypothetical protein